MPLIFLDSSSLPSKSEGSTNQTCKNCRCCMKHNEVVAVKNSTKKFPLEFSINPLRPNSDLSQTSHCNIKGLSVRQVMRIENMITQVKFY